MEAIKLPPYVNTSVVLESLNHTLTHLESPNVNGLLGYGGATSNMATDHVSCAPTVILPASTASSASTVTCKSMSMCRSSSPNRKKFIDINEANVAVQQQQRQQQQHSAIMLDVVQTAEVTVASESSQKSPCCSSLLPPPPALCSLTSSAIAATTPQLATATALHSTNDLARDHWYAHAHHHHHHHHPALTGGSAATYHHHHHHQSLTDELVMYTPAGSAASIGKYGFDSTAESYLNASANARYNVNVKGAAARHERASSFFDIPAVTHPYCYRFPSSPPAGILKKTDEVENPFGINTTSTSTSLEIGLSITNGKAEHPDSTTQNLNHHNLHGQSGHHLHQQHPHLSTPSHSSAFKFSHSHAGCITASASASVYQHYNTGQGGCGGYSLRSIGDLSPTLTLPVSTTNGDNDLKYESPYNPTISSTYHLRPNAVDSTTVTSTDNDNKFEGIYASNAISTSQAASQRRGSLQLWQFLVALLDEPTTSSSCIAWTGRGMEFKLIEPEEVARRWGIQKNRPAMNYDKLSRSLRYYYEKGIMQKVNGERYVYRFVCDPDALFNMAYGGHLSVPSAYTKTEQNHLLTKNTNTATDALIRSNANHSDSVVEEEINRERNLIGQLGTSKATDTIFYGNPLHKF